LLVIASDGDANELDGRIAIEAGHDLVLAEDVIGGRGGQREQHQEETKPPMGCRGGSKPWGGPRGRCGQKAECSLHVHTDKLHIDKYWDRVRCLRLNPFWRSSSSREPGVVLDVYPQLGGSKGTNCLV